VCCLIGVQPLLIPLNVLLGKVNYANSFRFEIYNEWRMKLGEAKTLEAIKSVMEEFIAILKADSQRYQEKPEELNFGKLRFPYWICQPYVRPR